MKVKRNGLAMLFTALIALLFISCDGGGGGTKTITTPDEVNGAAQALQDVSAADLAQLGISAPPDFALMSRPLTPLPAQDMPVGDPRWLLIMHPLKPRGLDDQFPRMMEPMIAALYTIKHSPSCATITTAGGSVCPPDPSINGSSCDTTITFDAGGCAITGTVAGTDVSLTLTGALHLVTTITQTGATPAVKGTAALTTTNFKIAEESGSFATFTGTIEEDYDGTAPSDGFTVVDTSPASDPMTITNQGGTVLIVEGDRTTVVVPQESVAITTAGDLTITPSGGAASTANILSTKTATVNTSGGVKVTLDRTATAASTGTAYHRTADLTLTPVDTPVTIVKVSGTETFTSPKVTTSVTITSVKLNLNCQAPVGGTATIKIGDRTITVTFDTTCNCTATWDDSEGDSGITNFCVRRNYN